MNWQHVQAFLWLRWRLLTNQWRRGGALSAALLTIFAVCAVALSIPLLFASFLLGVALIPKAAPLDLLLAWDGMVLAFTAFWLVGLMTELQRTDTLALSKFMHLPVSLKGAFLVNYLSSLLSLSVIVFLPIFCGAGLALVYSKGMSMLPVLPLTAALLLMVTALSFQFQGWLASLMSNPRRRRTVVMAATAIFVLIFQLPNLLNLLGVWGGQAVAGPSTAFVEKMQALDRGLRAEEFDNDEYQRRQAEIYAEYESASEQSGRERAEYWQRTAPLANMLLPIGWLPLGVMQAAEGHLWPPLLGWLGMTLIGGASLWRAYRTTLGLYQGQFTAGKRSGRFAATTAATPAREGRPSAGLLEVRLPWTSEPVSAVALGGLRSLLRSPEGKMVLMTPLLMSVVVGSMVLKLPQHTPEFMRPLVAIAAMAFSLFGTSQLMANQFGFDRDGFRVFVLCAAERRDILLGKNLAFAPLALGMAMIPLAIVMVVSPLRFEHVLSMIPQAVSMFLLFAIVTNLISIYAPMAMAAGALKPAKPKLVPVLLQMLMFLVFFPLSQAPTLLPLGVEALLEWRGWSAGLPICLLLSLAECAAVVFVYRLALQWEGGLLAHREQKILQTVTDHQP